MERASGPSLPGGLTGRNDRVSWAAVRSAASPAGGSSARWCLRARRTVCSVCPPPGPRGTLLHGTLWGDPPEGGPRVLVVLCWILSWPRPPACLCHWKTWASKHLRSQVLLRATLPPGTGRRDPGPEACPPVWGEGRSRGARPSLSPVLPPLTDEGSEVGQLPNAGGLGDRDTPGQVGWACVSVAGGATWTCGGPWAAVPVRRYYRVPRGQCLTVLTAEQG